ncbi:exodeoxyribonuclease V subunit gamma, partial [Thermodesulfobacteriota bacterium]
MAKRPMPGDRSQRKDDRYLFLESVLSAREKLYISYVGQSIQDNSQLPLSVLVSELLDYVARSFHSEKKDRPCRIEKKHRLQPFNPGYFRESNDLSSFSEKNFLSARALVSDRIKPLPFISEGLSDPSKEWNSVDVEDLCGFFTNPSKFLLERRLNIYLREGPAALEETEPFEVKGLERYKINQNLISRTLSGMGTEGIIPWARASGLLPHGAVGDYVIEDLVEGAERFAEKTAAFMKCSEISPINLNLEIAEFRVSGVISGLHEDRLLHYRYARLRAADRLRTWIYHLVLNSLSESGVPRNSLIAGLKGSGRKDNVWEGWEYPQMEEAGKILEDILRIYRSGLKRPLPFFPETSFLYAYWREMKKASKEDALEKAYNKWTGGFYSRGEGENEYFKLCFKDDDPLSNEFAAISEEVYEPMISHQERLEAG